MIHLFARRMGLWQQCAIEAFQVNFLGRHAFRGTPPQLHRAFFEELVCRTDNGIVVGCGEHCSNRRFAGSWQPAQQDNKLLGAVVTLQPSLEELLSWCG